MGSGGSVFKEIERGVRDTARKWKKDPWGEFIKVSTDAATGSLVRYEDGKWQQGSAVHRFDEIIGEFSGRNKARLQGYETERKIREAEDMAAIQRSEDLLARYRADLQASRGAKGIRDTAAARDRAAASLRGGQKLGDEQDVLGA